MSEETDLDALAERIEKAGAALTGNANSVGNAQININAGGIGVYIAATCCLMTLVAVVVASVFVAIGMSDLNQQTRELRQADMVQQAYINAGYTANPKEEEKQ